MRRHPAVRASRIFSAFALFSLMATGAGSAQPIHPPWRDTLVTRLAAAALIAQLRIELLTQPSATLTLEHWCAAHHLAAKPLILAELQHDHPPLPAAERLRLKIGASEPVRVRHVLLTCGGQTLSEANNWYVPARLTADMNHRLDTTDMPFGKVVAALDFKRVTVSSVLLWSSLPADWPATPTPPPALQGRLVVPDRLFENRAILTRGQDQLPFADLVETYRRPLLDFNLP